MCSILKETLITVKGSRSNEQVLKYVPYKEENTVLN